MVESRLTLPASHEFFQAWPLYQVVMRYNYMRHREVIAVLENWRDGRAHSPMSILDLGCGDGLVATTVFGRQPGISYCGVDLSRAALVCAQEHTRRMNWNTEWIEADLLSAVRHMHRQYDLVIAGFSLHHLGERDLAEALQHINRVLREQGSLVVYDSLRRGDETRDAYVSRFLTAVDTTWEAFEPTQRKAVREHVENCDFPMDLAQWAALSAHSSFSGNQLLYRDEDDFFGLIHFWKTTGGMFDKSTPPRI